MIICSGYCKKMIIGVDVNRSSFSNKADKDDGEIWWEIFSGFDEKRCFFVFQM